MGEKKVTGMLLGLTAVLLLPSCGVRNVAPASGTTRGTVAFGADPSVSVPLFPASSGSGVAQERKYWQAPQCGLQVGFSGDYGKETFRHDQNFESERSVVYSDVQNRSVEAAVCACADYSDITRPLANSFTEKALRDGGFTMTRIAYIEKSPLGSFSDAEGTSADPSGPTRMRLRTYWRSKCASSVFAGGPLNSQPSGGRGVDFLNAVSELGPAASAAPPSPAPGETPLAAKMRELKRMHEEGLITQDEYDAKRKTLLNAM
jgi:hypothetical protein